MTKSELKLHNGKDGAKAYIAFKGEVYDVTDSHLWQNGEHKGMHSAGLDLTPMLENAPHSTEVFENFEVVGTLEEEPSLDQSASDEDYKQQLRTLYKKYHPHPITVHFPIALHLFTAVFDLIFFTNPKEAYAVVIFYTFFAATVFGLLAMVPGMLSWWINYGLSKSKPFVIKIIVSTLTLLLGVVGILIYVQNPSVVYESSFLGITYHFIILITGVNVIILGYYGGKITWGDRSDGEEVKTENKAEIKDIKEVPEFTKLTLAKKYEAPFVSDIGKSPVKLNTNNKIKNTKEKSISVSILIGGAAGTGIDTLEKILSDSFKRCGYYIFSSKEYMSRVRGGSNTTLIRISDALIEAPCWEVDLFIAIDALSLEHAKARCTSNTLVLSDEMFSKQKTKEMLGNPLYTNTYIAGLIFGLFEIDSKILLQSVSEYFKEDSLNVEAVKVGLKTASELDASMLPKFPKADKDEVSKLHLMDGTTASGFGFLVGGCNFVGAYPMSPSTGVLNFMASMSKEFTIALEQSEDEIASLHMVLGAWYAGARALTTTSGGGFALMGEALSLSGMSEIPAVIYLAQRPGPATGLPTRSEQGDLNMALYSGHGPFPRVILAPGSLRECIDYAYLAFELADRFQSPVIYLSDEYLADAMGMIDDVDFSLFEQRRYICSTDAEYKRYVDTPSGVSPRGVPAFGDGLVCAEGHEHDERSQITEDYNKRVEMANKRARKEKALIAEAIAPEYIGNGEIAVVGWGSTRAAINEAIALLDDSRLTQVHFIWIHPLNPEHLEVLKKYKYIIMVENNADRAFANQLKMHDIKIDKMILQYNGFAFFVDQLKEMISKEIKELL
ncbi:MAG: 2-oxoacid:acceptor oxidoreductase subunit alpha [Sulfurimonas sp.]|jgi:2-oxoglutarate ferredoxin oxidoreductase subunit alpha|nr:2-oxoacid:acceptor oxidoreductase subunit alpha [Sulfurimonas sp.]